MVSRRKPIRDVLRRPLSGDSDAPDAAVGGPLSLSFAGAAFDFFGDPADLAFDDDATAAAVTDAAAVLGSDVG